MNQPSGGAPPFHPGPETWRPDAFASGLPGFSAPIAPGDGDALDGATRCFCGARGVRLSQSAVTDGAALRMEVAAGEGFVSLSFAMSSAFLMAGRADDLLQVCFTFGPAAAQGAEEIYVRANLKAGPNVNSYSERLDAAPGAHPRLFDLERLSLNRDATESGWIDLILNGPDPMALDLLDLRAARLRRGRF